LGNKILKKKYFFLVALIFLLVIDSFAISVSESIDPNIIIQIKKDFTSALSGRIIPNIGEQVNWAGGILTRINTNRILYLVNGKEEVLNVNSDIIQLAKKYPEIRDQWIADYKVNLETGTNITLNSPGVITTNAKTTKLTGPIAQFNLYENQALQVRNQEAETRKKIQENPEVITSIDCSRTSGTILSQSLKSDCEQLIKLLDAHNTLLSYEQKLKAIIDTTGGANVSIALDTNEFQAKFNPVVVGTKKVMTATKQGVLTEVCKGPVPTSSLKPGEPYSCPAKFDCGKHGKGPLDFLRVDFVAYIESFSDSNCLSGTIKSKPFLTGNTRQNSSGKIPLWDISEGCHNASQINGGCKTCGFYKVVRPGQYEKGICIFHDTIEELAVMDPIGHGPATYATTVDAYQSDRIVDDWSGMTQYKLIAETDASAEQFQCDGPPPSSLKVGENYTCPIQYNCGKGMVDFFNAAFTAKIYSYVSPFCLDASLNSAPRISQTFMDSTAAHAPVPGIGTGADVITSSDCQAKSNGGGGHKMINPGVWSTGVCKYRGPVKK
jgi:hypothetical protein